jgi:hypothetical protein
MTQFQFLVRANGSKQHVVTATDMFHEYTTEAILRSEANISTGESSQNYLTLIFQLDSISELFNANISTGEGSRTIQR